ncbi:Sec-independent protein translocase protein TATA, chloroplastic [Vitis vinifera]|uniref:Sec-independent protein translocase protein TATA, chloroplastic n=1 Tax=Vitis vinifera TaxID=29760 RepID=A0A438IH70_VITVI|nr:Sec-independent protein translocase protein TATA, chloroplastic [Vitis vinifera]
MAAALYLSSIPKPTQTLSFSSSHSNFFNAKTLVVARSRTRIRTQKRLTCTCLFGLGVPELVVIAGVAALVFGPKKLPEVGRSIGRLSKAFNRMVKVRLCWVEPVLDVHRAPFFSCYIV